MGAAAYNRGSARIRESIDAEARPVEYEIMDRLNAIPKGRGAGTPFGPVEIVEGNGGFWIACPSTGFGWWYQSMSDLMAGWRVQITGRIHAKWIAEPMPRVHSLLQ